MLVVAIACQASNYFAERYWSNTPREHSLKEKWQWVGYMSPSIKKDTSKGRVASVMACHFLNLMV
jgi:hypothetical protein